MSQMWGNLVKPRWSRWKAVRIMQGMLQKTETLSGQVKIVSKFCKKLDECESNHGCDFDTLWLAWKVQIATKCHRSHWLLNMIENAIMYSSLVQIQYWLLDLKTYDSIQLIYLDLALSSLNSTSIPPILLILKLYLSWSSTEINSMLSARHFGHLENVCESISNKADH